MKKILIPLLAAIMGTGGGVGAGLVLRTDVAADDPETATAAHHSDAVQVSDSGDHGDHAGHGDAMDEGFIKLPGQFTVPVLHDGEVRAMVVLALTIEIDEHERETVTHLLPRFQDAFLSVLFDHARIGGFDGDFTEAVAQEELKRALLKRAGEIVGPIVHGVLVTELARQNV